ANERQDTRCAGRAGACSRDGDRVRFCLPNVRLIGGRAMARRAALVAGFRTPFVRAGTDFAQLDVLDLARAVTVELLQQTCLEPRLVDHLIYGNVVRPVQYTNLARELVLAAGLPKRTPADTVTLACASACQAITDATNLIERGYDDVIIAGGDETLSNVPVALSPRIARAIVGASQ